jgi:hypothetical protein
MRYTLCLLLVAGSYCATAQRSVLTTDETIPIPPIHFDASGTLIVKASASSSPGDFDFLVGKWKMHHRRLNRRLEGCRDWTEFNSEDENAKILSGSADMDTYRTTEMPGMESRRGCSDLTRAPAGMAQTTL